MLVMERDAALRALRLLRSGTSLTLTAMLDLDIGGPYERWKFCYCGAQRAVP